MIAIHFSLALRLREKSGPCEILESAMSAGNDSGQWADYAERRAYRIRASRRVPIATILEMLRLPDAFRTWLVQQHPEAIVGDFYTPDNSPLANFLWAALGVYVWTADKIFDGKHSVEMPGWCKEMTYQEARRIESHTGERTSWTAAEVLDLLHEIGKDE